jgi:sugar phosphate isomerase/epimerase
MTRRKLLRTSLTCAPAMLLPLRADEAPPTTAGFRLGIITDEVSSQLETSLDFISSNHLHWCELREIWGKNLMNASPEELSRAKLLIREHNLQVSDIASPIFKWNLPQMPANANEKRDEFKASFVDSDTDRLLNHSFELAHFFRTRKVRIFSFWRVPDPEKAYPHVRDRLAQAAETAAKNDIVLVLENEQGCNVATGRELGRVLRDVNSPALRGNWDAANAVMTGEADAYPNGYNAVRGLFAHVHIKDVRTNPKSGKREWAPVGGGVIDWHAQIRDLRKDGYEGTMSLETHYRNAAGDKLESTPDYWRHPNHARP